MKYEVELKPTKQDISSMFLSVVLKNKEACFIFISNMIFLKVKFSLLNCFLRQESLINIELLTSPSFQFLDISNSTTFITLSTMLVDEALRMTLTISL